MTINIWKDITSLKLLIHCFVSRSNDSFNLFTLLWSKRTIWSLDELWIRSLVSLISFYPFKFFKIEPQVLIEDLDIWTKTSLIRPINPNNLSTLNRNSNFIPESIFVEFMTEPLSIRLFILGPGILNPEVRSVNTDQEIIPNIPLKTIIK